ncbi:F-box domain protein [Aspergillus japonicus CBS 114.51]|uniref:F-box domain protein n=1 Tax=Aspergillus japonicus CBS 114.51 TaxID=1448312 RepID=A0A8T8WR98_ASPJA|nr:F-box domain protein [Aspergillus japonicus CBS 114.51]RAH78375.1 F-box domain protein [Aspergillus japonicus CBS 114.51]
MAFDCYCAICGVGFCGMHIEPPSEEALERRRRWIEKRRRALQAGKDLTQLPRDSEEDANPVRSYDPRIVGWENISWLYKAHCLGMNQNAAAGSAKAFLSDEGYYADAGELIVKAGSNSSRSSQKVYSCYGQGSDEAPGPVLPFHWCCFEILTHALTGSTDTKKVNLEVLYNVMSPLCNMKSSALDLSYGEDIQRAQGRYWECTPGVEYCATHPTDTPALPAYIQTNMESNSKLKIASAEIDLRGRRPASPFGKLPLELVHQICMFLPSEDLKSLAQASLSVHLVTQDNLFWKKFMQWDMPWFWELQASKGQKLNDEVNYKQLYLWLDKMTTARYGMDDANLIGVANRRRIWGVCEELADRYHKGLAQAPAVPVACASG